MTIRELLVERYAPLRGLKDRSVVIFGQTIDRLEEFLGRVATLEDFTDLQMAKYLRWRAQTPSRRRLPAPATVAKDRAHLVALANLAARKRLIPEFVDFPRLKVPKKPPRGYTVEEMSALIRQARHRIGYIGTVPASWLWMTIVRAEWESGERCGSLLRLRWTEVDLARRTLTLLGENRKGGVETIERAISEELAAWLATRAQPTGLVWPWLEHRREQSFYTSFRQMAERAGVTPRGTHAIRKSSGSYVKAGGGDATEHLGHANPRTTRDHYFDTRITGRQSALDYLPPLDLTEPPPDQKPAGDGDRPAA
jgi:integrase